MDSVKREGYLKIGNKTIDNLIDNKSVSNKMRAYFLTVRMLNGWDKESLEIPVSTYSNRLGTGKRYTKRLLKKLKEENLIHRNGSLTSIPGDYIQWWWSGQNLPPPQGGHNLPKGGSKETTETVVKKDTLNTPTLQINKPGGFGMKMTRKEINKLEGKPWLRATMILHKTFDINFIDEVFSKNSFRKLYDCWDQLQEAYNVRDRKAWFLAKLNNWVDPEE